MKSTNGKRSRKRFAEEYFTIIRQEKCFDQIPYKRQRSSVSQSAISKKGVPLDECMQGNVQLKEILSTNESSSVLQSWNALHSDISTQGLKDNAYSRFSRLSVESIFIHKKEPALNRSWFDVINKI